MYTEAFTIRFDQSSSFARMTASTVATKVLLPDTTLSNSRAFIHLSFFAKKRSLYRHGTLLGLTINSQTHVGNPFRLSPPSVGS